MKINKVFSIIIIFLLFSQFSLSAYASWSSILNKNSGKIVTKQVNSSVRNATQKHISKSTDYRHIHNPQQKSYRQASSSYDVLPNGTAAKKGTPPPDMSPQGTGRNGAFREAKRNSNIPVSQQPSRVTQNFDKQRNVQPGKIYEFEIPASGGGTRTIRIRDDSAGHNYGVGNPQNRGSHFNDEAKNHYHY